MDCHSLADGKIRSVFMQIVLGTVSLKEKRSIFVKSGAKPCVGRKALSWYDTVFTTSKPAPLIQAWVLEACVGPVGLGVKHTTSRNGRAP